MSQETAGTSDTSTQRKKEHKVQSISTLRTAMLPESKDLQKQTDQEVEGKSGKDDFTGSRSGSGVYQLAPDKDRAEGAVELYRFRRGANLCTVQGAQSGVNQLNQS